MHLISMKAILDAVTQFPQHKEELLFLGRTIEKGHCPTRHVFTHKEYDRFTEKHRTKGKK